MAAAPDPRVTVVIITHNRQDRVGPTVERLAALPERPRVVVVDNASDPPVEVPPGARERPLVLHLDRNPGAAARTVGVVAASTPYVAFCDDDSGWDPGALARAADRLDAHPGLALVAGRLLVGDDGAEDPVTGDMRRAPLGHGPAGQHVLGFLACAAVVRRRAYLAVGGFHPRFLVGGEESLLAWDLAAAGWGLAYADDVVARHWPAAGPRPARARIQARNSYWTTWLRRPLPAALRATARQARDRRGEPESMRALVEAVAGLGWVSAGRRVLPPSVERAVETLHRERVTAGSSA